MSWRWSAALLALFLAWPSARCTPSTFTLQGANVRVVYPVEYRNISIAMALADFGRPSYGATIRGKLVYPSEDPIYYSDGKARRCAGVACQYACGMLNTSVPPFQFTKSPGELLIMLLDRGPRDYDQPCYFITKVYNAQLAGADAVLVADDIGGEDLTTPVVPEEEAAAHLLDSLTISAALIRKEDGDTLKTLLQSQRPVTVALNWSDMEPRKQQVSWEYWTTTSDQCGTLCAEQTAFLRAMKPVAVALDQQNRTAFSPHFMIWSCPPIYSDSIECQSECILDGQYCAPDPDGQYLAGYSGKDVLAMNVRSLCFARLARQAGLPWLWWDYADRFAANCTSATNSYNATCAQQVFTDVTGPLLLNNNGTAVWEECVATGSPPTQAGVNTTGLKLPLLEEELNAQQGDSVVAAVSILPTVRVNGLQYRGTLDKKGVLRALCSAFPKNQEPTVCNEKWVSDDECEVGSVGYINCRVGDPLAGGNTRCINTFSSYECDCGQGWVAGQKDTGEQVCNDVNECLATNVRLTDPKCSCERCACINTPGSYKCTGELPQSCSPQYNFGGCWSANVDGALHHACVDTIWDYKRKALNGTLDQSLDKWYRCQCPGCFSTAGGNDGNPQCSKMCDMSQCVNELCVAPGTPGTASGGPVPAPSGGGGGRGGGGSGGMSAWGVLLVVLVSVGVTMGGLYAVYHYVLRQRMEGEIRDIMSQYMPLGDSNLRRGGGGGGSGRARNGATSLSPVEEEGDAYEDAPLMGISSQSSGGAARPPVQTGGSMQLQTVSSGASLGGLPSQRSAFGSLMSPPAHHVPPSLPSPSGYQPPLPLPDDDEDSSGLAMDRPAATALVSRESGGGGKGQAGGAQAKPAAPVGEAPLLGEGPL